MAALRTEKILIAAFLICSCALAAQANPLYKEPLQFNNALNIDPLQAAASDDAPMIHNDNYDMIMPDSDDHDTAESMHYQNFDKFYDPQMIDNVELEMNESQFTRTIPVREPQPLSDEERYIRQKVEKSDLKHEYKIQKKLKKGSTKPHEDALGWEKFDYDLYSADPSKGKKAHYY